MEPSSPSPSESSPRRPRKRLLETGERPGRVLSRSKRREFIALYQLGAPQQVVYQKLGIRFEDFQVTLDAYPEFLERLQVCENLLIENVAAAIYRSAMGGSVSAQANYLRLCKPSPQKPRKSRDSSDDDLDHLDNDEALKILESRLVQCTAPFMKQDGWTPPPADSEGNGVG